jgi:SAM-dependent methyltransferase
MSASQATGSLSISIPPRADGDRDQDAEWCWVTVNGSLPRRIRFHDYGEIYAIPGLYERLFHEELRCASPATVCGLLGEVLAQSDWETSELRVLDLGAGSGIVAEELQKLGADQIVGLDIIDEARQAAERDRPGIYDSYLVADLCDPDAETDRALSDANLNCLTSVAALGFGDIPPSAFANAFNYIAAGGLVAFTLRDRFLDESDKTGFRRLIDRMLSESVAVALGRRRYVHRLSTSGKPLYYVAMVVEKTSDIPLDWL